MYKIWDLQILLSENLQFFLTLLSLLQHKIHISWLQSFGIYPNDLAIKDSRSIPMSQYIFSFILVFKFDIHYS